MSDLILMIILQTAVLVVPAAISAVYVLRTEPQVDLKKPVGIRPEAPIERSEERQKRAA